MRPRFSFMKIFYVIQRVEVLIGEGTAKLAEDKILINQELERVFLVNVPHMGGQCYAVVSKILPPPHPPSPPSCPFFHPLAFHAAFLNYIQFHSLLVAWGRGGV